MANDAIFDDPSQPAAPPAQPTAEDLTRQLAIGIQQAVAPLAQRVEQLAQEVTASRQPATPQAPAGNPAPSYLDNFITSPEASIRDVVDKTVSPVVGPLADYMIQDQVGKSKGEITARYGEKAWTEVFEPRLNYQLNEARKANPQWAANPQAVKVIVSSIRGAEELADKLDEYKQETAREAAEAAKKMARPPSFVGSPGRQFFGGDDSEPLPSEDSEFLTSLKRNGYSFDEKAYRQARATRLQFGGDMEKRYEAEMAAKAAKQAGAR